MTKMKLHSSFVADLHAMGFTEQERDLLIRTTRMGLTPEGWEFGAPLNVPQFAELTKAEPTNAEAAPVTMAATRGYTLGKASRKELEGVHTNLVRCVQRTIVLTRQDFTVFDGIRTYKEQQAHVRNGTSKTMQSKHLQGLAVDLVPWIDGKLVWDWDGCCEIAYAMDRAATELGIADRITWGGAWDRRLSDFGGNPSAYRMEVENYKDRHPGKDFIDGPHFEYRP